LKGRNKIKQKEIARKERKEGRKKERKKERFYDVTDCLQMWPTVIARYLMGLCSCQAPSMYRITVYGRLWHSEGRNRDDRAQIRRHLFVNNATSRKVITLDIKPEQGLLPKGAPKQ
jgi:hypothetical protein